MLPNEDDEPETSVESITDNAEILALIYIFVDHPDFPMIQQQLLEDE